jgi:hypothetical protein
MKNFLQILLTLILFYTNFIFSQVTINDPRFNEQWYLYHQGVPTNQRADIRAWEAWSITTGSQNIKIAIIENNSIPNSTHPDLLGRITTHNTILISEHACQVAGMIAANPNNIGIVGVNWQSPLNAYAFTNITQDLNDRILQARNDGNKIISISHGHTEPVGDVELASTYNNNVTTFKSMGNNQGSGISYPATHAGVIAVGASTIDNTRALYSNFGNHIEFLAPGGDGFGAPNNRNILTTSSNDYVYSSGTSLATPLTAGAAGLLLAKRNDLYNDDIKNLLIISCDKLPQMQGQNFTQEHGYGRVNIKKALDFLQPPYQLSHLSAFGGIVHSNTDLYQMSIFGVPGLGSGVYLVKRYDVRKNVSFNHHYDHFVWGRGVGTNGWSGANPNYGMNFCDVIPGSITSNSATLRTFVYEIVGHGWYPTSPQNVSFNYTVLGKPLYAPIISGFTQTPNPICIGQTGTVTVNLSQGNGNLTYSWSYSDKPSYVTVTFSGNKAYVTNNYSGNRYAKGNPPPEVPEFTLYCTVTNSAGSSYRFTTCYVSTQCGGCPTLAFEENGELINENPLLITSLSNPGTDITDYYFINTPVTPVNNRLKFTIHEPETEHTWFDQVKLIEARVNSNEYAAVTSDGEVVNYVKQTVPFIMLLNDSIDVTELLADLDSNIVSVEAGDYITVFLIRGESSGDDEDNMIMGGEEPGPPQKRISGNVKFISSINKGNTDASADNIIMQDDFIENYGNFYFRPNLSIICKRLGSLPNGNLQIIFEQAVDLDYLVIARNLRSARIRELLLLEAQHSESGDITSRLSNIDEVYGELLPGERIDFTFAANEGKGRRAYILKTVGRYETDSAYVVDKVASLQKSQDNNIILENALFDNYPNPFNPATIINYAIKEAGLVSVKVYDILGSEVATLVNENKPAGIYDVEFNASNLPSGVYFYSISTKEFHQVKKMLLIK